MLRLVGMEHLIAEPRPQKGFVLELGVQLAVSGKHFLFACAGLPHVPEMVEERLAPIGMIKPDEHMPAGAHVALAAASYGGMTIVGVMQDADRNDQIEHRRGFVKEQVFDAELGA